jgi:DNA-binding HxlR family transcriptional regulator
MQCSVARSLEQFGSWWSLLIVRDALMGARRFKDFERSLGIAKNTLTTRLIQLVDNGIMEKVPAADGSSHQDYALTEKGLDIAPVIIALAQWGDQWAVHADGPSFALLDNQTGARISRVLPRRNGGEEIALKDLRVERL